MLIIHYVQMSNAKSAQGILRNRIEQARQSTLIWHWQPNYLTAEIWLHTQSASVYSGLWQPCSYLSITTRVPTTCFGRLWRMCLHLEMDIRFVNLRKFYISYIHDYLSVQSLIFSALTMKSNIYYTNTVPICIYNLVFFLFVKIEAYWICVFIRGTICYSLLYFFFYSYSL